jgi:hypothetical protein
MEQHELYNKILNASNNIAQKQRNSGDFMIVSSQVADVLNGFEKQEQRKKKMKRILNDLYNSRNW